MLENSDQELIKYKKIEKAWQDFEAGQEKPLDNDLKWLLQEIGRLRQSIWVNEIDTVNLIDQQQNIARDKVIRHINENILSGIYEGDDEQYSGFQLVEKMKEVLRQARDELSALMINQGDYAVPMGYITGQPGPHV